jgi:hypothetical protein
VFKLHRDPQPISYSGAEKHEQMTETIIPAFRDAPEEGKTVGRLLAGYSELEVEMLGCVLEVSGGVDAAVRALYGTRGEQKRIEAMRSLTEVAFQKAGLGPTFAATMSDMHWCRRIRNQYAHCQWYYTTSEGLCFIDLEELAKRTAKIDVLTRDRVPVDIGILSRQEAFFKYVQKCFWFLAEQYKINPDQRSTPLFQLPAKMDQPPLHN